MTQQELREIKEFYETVILQGIIKPLEINHIYQLIYPEVENPMGMAYRLKQRAISVFVQNKQWEVLNILEDLFSESEEEVATDFEIIPQQVDITQTTLPKNGELESVGTVENQSQQTHSEDVANFSETDDEEITDEEVMEALKPKIKRKRSKKK